MGGSETTSPPGDNPLAAVSEALQRSRYRDAIDAAARLPRTRIESEQARPLMDAMLSAAAGLQDDSDDEVKAYNLVLGLAATLPPTDARNRDIKTRVESALFNKGVVLGHQGRSEEAIAAYDDLIRRYESAGGPRSNERIARALFNKGVRLAEINRPGEALGVYDELIKRFATATEPRVVEALAKAMVNRGIAHARLIRYDEAIADFDDVVILWGDSPDPFFRERAALALLNKATALVKLGRPEGALGAYEEVVDRYGDDTSAEMRKQISVARAMASSVRNEIT